MHERKRGCHLEETRKKGFKM